MGCFKYYLQGYFNTLRMEVHNKNIGVTMICPGLVYSNILKNAFRENLQVCNKMHLINFLFMDCVQFSFYPQCTRVQDVTELDKLNFDQPSLTMYRRNMYSTNTIETMPGTLQMYLLVHS